MKEKKKKKKDKEVKKKGRFHGNFHGDREAKEDVEDLAVESEILGVTSPTNLHRAVER